MVKAWLDKHGVEYEERDMNACPPSAEEILRWSDMSRLPLKQFLRPRRFSLRMLLLNNQMALAEREMRAYIISAALASPAIPGTFSVPERRFCCCPPPNKIGWIFTLSFTYKNPTPLGP